MTSTRKSVNKSAFVRLHPKTTPSEIVALGKTAGISFDEKYVHNVRWKDKKGISEGKVPGVRTRRSSPTKSVNGRAVGFRRPRTVVGTVVGTPFNLSLAEQFVQLAMDIGLASAEALIAKVRSAANSLTVDRLTD
jgi:hypothetical protein